MRSRWSSTALAALVAAVVAGCGSNDPAVIGRDDGVLGGFANEVSEITAVSGDDDVTVPPVCENEIPADVTACGGAPQNLGELELDETRKVTLQVPREVSTAGYRVRLNGEPLPRHEGVLNEQALELRIPASVLEQPGEAVLTVEGLRSREQPPALWQFVLGDPSELAG